MTKILHVPDEARFVRALALAIDPGDTLNFLLAIGTLDSHDVAIVRRTREALAPAYERASDRKDWEQVHTIGILQQALATPDSAAYLAYHTRGFSPSDAADRFAHALTIVGCAADTLGLSHRRPWKIQDDDLSLPHWREQIWRLLLDMPGNALPHLPTSTQGPHDSSTALVGNPTTRCLANLDGERP